MASKVEAEIEVKSNAEKLWGSMKEFATLFPIALPHMYQSIQVLKGDGKSAGTITFVTFVPGDSTIKESINVMDDESKTINYDIIEGDLLNYYSNLNVNVSVAPKGNNGSVVKWSCKFDKVNQQIPNPHLLKDTAIKGFQDLDAYLELNI